MKLKDGITEVSIKPTDFKMVSASRTKILLPFIGELWDDIYFEATQMALSVADTNSQIVDSIYYDEHVAKTTLHIGFSFLYDKVLSCAELTVKTITGKIVSKRFMLSCSENEAADILDCFFKQSCPGIDPKYAAFYAQYLLRWKTQKKQNFLVNSY